MPRSTAARHLDHSPPRLRIHQPPPTRSGHTIDLMFPVIGGVRLTAWTREDFMAMPPSERPLDAFWDEPSGFYAHYVPLGHGAAERP